MHCSRTSGSVRGCLTQWLTGGSSLGLAVRSPLRTACCTAALPAAAPSVAPAAAAKQPVAKRVRCISSSTSGDNSSSGGGDGGDGSSEPKKPKRSRKKPKPSAEEAEELDPEEVAQRRVYSLGESKRQIDAYKYNGDVRHTAHGQLCSRGTARHGTAR